eukprot:CAMPEP_0202695536 /NCGR_PEP_ID=MMETSP1385-20130828/9112_1 /ASSEMBLY_ACC=CAM_ASM_000861 /TAXON_ID=933848 /ORGANISM="Elphidium margaritaceum" /LENGTH=428 /DNA_ID=CAMNT_0049351583 /DNA_START=44 /DNA_END=1333 /DNA_ORIENTATION=-
MKPTAATEEKAMASADSKPVASKKPNVFFMLGGPGAGKGTQCANLVDEFGLIHLSAGDLLRAERNSGSKDAKLINEYITSGQIVPVEITVRLIKRAMQMYMAQQEAYNFVIDGFPRNHDNLDGWNKLMSEFAVVPFLLLLECDEQEMTKRILSRAATSTVQRKDDNLQTLQKRFKVFREETMPVVAVFDAQQKCRRVSSMGSVEAIYAAIRPLFVCAMLRPQIVFVLGGPGAGKGTQCDKLTQDTAFAASFAHLSAGDLLRAERNSGSANAQLINQYIQNGEIVPVEITVRLIETAIEKCMQNEGKYVFVIDGFPRNYDNYNGWNKIMSEKCNVAFLLVLECTEEEMTKRILSRAEKSAVKRVDDNADTLKKRFKVFHDSTVPIMKEFEKMNKLTKVDAIGSIDDIYLKIKPHFVPLVKPNKNTTTNK